MAEFVIDNERAYVLVRLPAPELTNIQIDRANVKRLRFDRDKFGNGSFEEGVNLAEKMYNEAEVLIKRAFSSNQNLYSNAKEAATNAISHLIRQLNPDISDLTIEVEFME